MRPEPIRNPKRQTFPRFYAQGILRVVGIYFRRLHAIPQPIMPIQLDRLSAPLLLKAIGTGIDAGSAKIEAARATLDCPFQAFPVEQHINVQPVKFLN